jgi:hypothetical protein
MDAGPSQLTRPALWVIALLALLYGGAHLGWYWGTPLGQSAVLDERENLRLAAQITSGTLPPEPFYRAMGYPLFLAGLRATGLLPDDLPLAATAAGLLLHVLNTLLVARLAQKWFGTARAGFAAGLLHGFNPVLIHYATQILDGTLANTFFLAGLLCLPERDDAPPSCRRALGLSLAWTAAALVRPQFLLAWLALPPVWMIARGAGRPWRAQLRPLGFALGAGGLLWLAQGAWCWRVSGEFRLLPWQGAYNLWAANTPGANGRYYVQTMLLEAPAGGAQENPARYESRLLYQRATGDTRPLRIGPFNDYWRQQLITETLAHPAAWLQLELRKAYYLANNTEQYNNKTYSFHKARSPWLRYNPLGWGLLFIGGLAGLVALGRTHRPLVGAILLTGAAVAAGLLLFFASARFRLPLAALLCALAGGAVTAPQRWWPGRLRARLATALLLVVAGVITFTGWFGAADESTYVQDHLLLASAAERTGDDRITWDEARAALALRPGHPDALRLGLTGYFNLLLRELPPSETENEWLDLARQLYSQTATPTTHPQANLIALALWRAHDPAGLRLWREKLAGQNDSEALAALCLAGEAGPEEMKRMKELPLPAAAEPFLLMAKTRFTPEQSGTGTGNSRRSPASAAALRRATDNIFPAPR